MHHSQHDIVYGYTAQGTKPNQPSLDLVKLVTADNPAKGMSLRNLQHALHMMKKAKTEELRYNFGRLYPETFTKAQIETELETRCSLRYLPLKKVPTSIIKAALNPSTENSYVSFLSDNTCELSEEVLWRAYNRSELSDELESRLEAKA